METPGRPRRPPSSRFLPGSGPRTRRMGNHVARDAEILELERQFWAWRLVVFGARLGKTPDIRPVESAEFLAEMWLRTGQELLTGLARVIIHDQHLAEDAVAVALRKSRDAAEGFDGRCPVYWWLRRIVRSTSINVANALRRRRDAIPFADAPIESVAATRNRSVVNLGELEAAIEAIISKMPQKQAAAIHLMLFDEMSVSEIANFLGDKYDAVQSRVYEAKIKLRGELERKGFTLAALPDFSLLANALRSGKPSSEAIARIAALAREPMRIGVIRQPWFMGSLATATAAAALASICVHAWAAGAPNESGKIGAKETNKAKVAINGPATANNPAAPKESTAPLASASIPGYGALGTVLMPESQNGMPFPVPSGEVHYRDNDGNQVLIGEIVNGKITPVSSLPKNLKPGRIIFIDSDKTAARVEFVRAPGPNTEVALSPGLNHLGVLTLEPIAWVSTAVHDATGMPIPGVQLAFVGDLKLQAAGRLNGAVRTNANGFAEFAIPAGVPTKIRAYGADYISDPKSRTLSPGEKHQVEPFVMPALVTAKYRFVTPAGLALSKPALMKESVGGTSTNITVQPSAEPEVVTLLRKPNVALKIRVALAPGQYSDVTLPPVTESSTSPLAVAVPADTWTTRIARPEALAAGDLVRIVVSESGREIYEKEETVGEFVDFSLPRPESANGPVTVWVLKDEVPVGIWIWTATQKAWTEGAPLAKLTYPQQVWSPRAVNEFGQGIAGAMVGARLGDRMMYTSITDANGQATLALCASDDLTYFMVAPQCSPWIQKPGQAPLSLPETVTLSSVAWLKLVQQGESFASEKWSFTPPEEPVDSNRSNDQGTRYFGVPQGVSVEVPIWVSTGRFGRPRQSGPVDTTTVDSIPLTFEPGATITLQLTGGLPDGIAAMMADTGGVPPSGISWAAISTDHKFSAVGRIRNDGSFEVRGLFAGSVVDVFPIATGALSAGSRIEDYKKQLEDLRANPITAAAIRTIRLLPADQADLTQAPLRIDFSSVAASVSLRPGALLPGERLELRTPTAASNGVDQFVRLRYDLTDMREVRLVAGTYIVSLTLAADRTVPQFEPVSPAESRRQRVVERVLHVRPGERIELP